jgi:hypothetical protein
MNNAIANLRYAATVAKFLLLHSISKVQVCDARMPNSIELPATQ